MIRTSLVTAGGLGLLPRAPGTWGSLPPVALGVLIMLLAPQAMLPTMIAIAALASIGCLALTRYATQRFGREDPGEMVLDEVAGMALALAVVPWPWFAQQTLSAMLLIGVGFIAFRIFDITKPGPINTAQKLPGGWGVLIDDLLAGIVAGGACWITTLIMIT